MRRPHSLCSVCHNIMTTSPVLRKSPFSTTTAQTRPTEAWAPLDLQRCAVVPGTKTLCSTSLWFCMWRCETSTDLTSLSSTSHRCSVGLRCGDSGRRVNTWNLLLCDAKIGHWHQGIFVMFRGQAGPECTHRGRQEQGKKKSALINLIKQEQKVWKPQVRESLNHSPN